MQPSTDSATAPIPQPQTRGNRGRSRPDQRPDPFRVCGAKNRRGFQSVPVPPSRAQFFFCGAGTTQHGHQPSPAQQARQAQPTRTTQKGLVVRATLRLSFLMRPPAHSPSLTTKIVRSFARMAVEGLRPMPCKSAWGSSWCMHSFTNGFLRCRTGGRLGLAPPGLSQFLVTREAGMPAR